MDHHRGIRLNRGIRLIYTIRIEEKKENNTMMIGRKQEKKIKETRTYQRLKDALKWTKETKDGKNVGVKQKVKDSGAQRMTNTVNAKDNGQMLTVIVIL